MHIMQEVEFMYSMDMADHTTWPLEKGNQKAMKKSREGKARPHKNR